MKIYTSYQCSIGICRKEFVLLTEDVQAIKDNERYIVCPYCSSKKVKIIKASDSLKECMSSRSYKRVKGAIHQK